MDQSILTPVAFVTDYFSNMVKYTQALTNIVEKIAANISKLVVETVDNYEDEHLLPVALIIFISSFVPIILYITLKATLSMYK